MFFSRGEFCLSHLNAHLIKINRLFAKTERTNEKKRKRKTERMDGWMDEIIFLTRTFRPKRIYWVENANLLSKMFVGMKVWRRRSLDESSDMRLIKTTFLFVFRISCLNISRKHVHIILTSLNPLLYSKTGVYRGIHYFSYFCSKT